MPGLIYKECISNKELPNLIIEQLALLGNANGPEINELDRPQVQQYCSDYFSRNFISQEEGIQASMLSYIQKRVIRFDHLVFLMMTFQRAAESQFPSLDAMKKIFASTYETETVRYTFPHPLVLLGLHIYLSTVAFSVAEQNLVDNSSTYPEDHCFSYLIKPVQGLLPDTKELRRKGLPLYPQYPEVNPYLSEIVAAIKASGYNRLDFDLLKIIECVVSDPASEQLAIITAQISKLYGIPAELFQLPGQPKQDLTVKPGTYRPKIRRFGL